MTETTRKPMNWLQLLFVDPETGDEIRAFTTTSLPMGVAVAVVPKDGGLIEVILTPDEADRLAVKCERSIRDRPISPGLVYSEDRCSHVQVIPYPSGLFPSAGLSVHIWSPELRLRARLSDATVSAFAETLAELAAAARQLEEDSQRQAVEWEAREAELAVVREAGLAKLTDEEITALGLEIYLPTRDPS